MTQARNAWADDAMPVWDQMLAGIPGVSRQPVKELTAFWPMVGQRYAGELMVIGQAVNNWIPNIWVEYLRSPGPRRAFAEEARAASANDGERCRMLWVIDQWSAREGYNSKRSPFWSALNDLTPRLFDGGVDPSDWPSHLAWSNLYKVAPAQANRPVPGGLARAQQLGAIELLRLELDGLAPKRVLATVGDWIHPFVEPLGLDIEWSEGNVLARGRDDAGRTWVVAWHPRGKRRAEWVNQVSGAFLAMAAD